MVFLKIINKSGTVYSWYRFVYKSHVCLKMIYLVTCKEVIVNSYFLFQALVLQIIVSELVIKPGGRGYRFKRADQSPWGGSESSYREGNVRAQESIGHKLFQSIWFKSIFFLVFLVRTGNSANHCTTLSPLIIYLVNSSCYYYRV